jgi:hypothetical protein
MRSEVSVNPAARTRNVSARLRSTLVAAAAIALFAIALLPTFAGSHTQAVQEGDRGPALRIGTYDSRAVAIAYARSEFLQSVHEDIVRRHAEAKEAGDEQLVAEIEASGSTRQLRLHLQGFSTAPVDDLLDAVRERLPEVARQNNIAVLACSVDFHDGSVEIVDVTDALVELYKPDAQTLAVIADLRKQQPMAIEAVAKMHANH